LFELFFDEDVIALIESRTKMYAMQKGKHTSELGYRVAKVRPLLAMMNERFLRFFPQQAALSIDESMVPYYGRHGMKQFIRGKPVRLRYKVWSPTLGYCVQFEPYQRFAVTDSTIGLGGSVVLDLISELPPAKYQLFFDNFFTNIRFLNTLSDMNV
jgi:predicted glycosyl hydrolase (DUF1957 family)